MLVLPVKGEQPAIDLLEAGVAASSALLPLGLASLAGFDDFSSLLIMACSLAA